MPKTKKAVKATPKRKAKVVVTTPHMTKTLFGSFYLLILAVLSLMLILITTNLPR